MERPMMVYVTSSDATDAQTRKLEDVCFPDERVAIGSKFFNTIKVTAGDAQQDRLLAKYGKSEPRIVLVNRDYSVAAVVEGKGISSGKLVKAMAKAAKKDYKDSFDTMVSKYAKLLNELDRLEGEKALAADALNRAGDNKAKIKKAKRKQAQYEKDFAKWQKAEEKLLTFRLKTLKKPKV
ncbi:MAG: hypothetical protein AAGD14_14385 [Planctomycetota bacterium]